jgi:integrase
VAGVRNRNFSSVFTDELNNYIDLQISYGFKEVSYLSDLRVFDRFCLSQLHSISEFTRDLADQWVQLRKGESATNRYSRVNTVKNFLIYLRDTGYDVFVTRDAAPGRTEFKPHIYTYDEIERYFSAVDSYDAPKNRMIKIQLPILFRLLYCCGMRINETLGIRKMDVDIDEGILKLFETKNDCERYVVLGDDLKSLMWQYADKSFYLLADDEYIFSNTNGTRYSGEVLYDYHREILRRAGIPYIGGGAGPRIHDWRHTFSVYAFKKMIDSGMDMYVALPILSTFLGHKSIYATEVYVRLTMSMFPYIEEKFKEKAEAVFGGVDCEEH